MIVCSIEILCTIGSGYVISHANSFAETAATATSQRKTSTITYHECNLLKACFAISENVQEALCGHDKHTELCDIACPVAVVDGVLAGEAVNSGS